MHKPDNDDEFNAGMRYAFFLISERIKEYPEITTEDILAYLIRYTHDHLQERTKECLV